MKTRFLYTRERWSLPEIKPLFLSKGQGTGFSFIATHPGLWQSEGGTDWSCLRRVKDGRHWKETWEISCQDPCDQSFLPSIISAAIFHERHKPLPAAAWRKAITLPLRIQLTLPWFSIHVEETAAEAGLISLGKLRGCQWWALEWSHYTYFLRNLTGTSPQGIENDRKSWFLTDPTSCIQGDLPCQGQKNILRQTQTCDSGLGKHIHHLP